MDVLVFAKAYDNYKNILKPDEMLIFTGKGRKDERSGGMSFVCDRVITIEEMRVQKGARLMLEIAEGQDLGAIRDVLLTGQDNDHRGVLCEVSIRSNGVKAEVFLKNNYAPTDKLLNQLKNLESISLARFMY